MEAFFMLKGKFSFPFLPASRTEFNCLPNKLLPSTLCVTSYTKFVVDYRKRTFAGDGLPACRELCSLMEALYKVLLVRQPATEKSKVITYKELK